MRKLRLAICVLAIVPSSSFSSELLCSDLADLGSLLVDICECGKLQENDVERLNCYDRQAQIARIEMIRSKARAEQLRRSPGGIEAMKRAIKLGPPSQSE